MPRFTDTIQLVRFPESADADLLSLPDDPVEDGVILFEGSGLVLDAERSDGFMLSSTGVGLEDEGNATIYFHKKNAFNPAEILPGDTVVWVNGQMRGQIVAVSRTVRAVRVAFDENLAGTGLPDGTYTGLDEAQDGDFAVWDASLQQWVPQSHEAPSTTWANLAGKPETATRWPTFDEVSGAAVFAPRPGDQLTGTVDVTAGEQVISGIGTQFQSEIQNGLLHVDGVTYQGFVSSDTSFFAYTAPQASGASLPAYTVSAALDVQDFNGDPILHINAFGEFTIGTLPEGLFTADTLPVGGPIGSYGISNGLRLGNTGSTFFLTARPDGSTLVRSGNGFDFTANGQKSLWLDYGATALNSNQPEAAFDVHLPIGHATPALQTRDTAGNPVFSIDANGNVEFMNPSIGIIQHSPDGTRWHTGVDNAGNFTATAL